MTAEIETVYVAAEAMKAEGTTPSVRTVTAKLGGGSATYVAPYLALWKARDATLDAADCLPDQFIEDAKVLAVHLWNAAADHASIERQALVREIDRLTNDAADREAELSSQITALEAYGKAAARELDGLKKSSRDLEARVLEAEADVEAASKAQADAERQHLAAEKRWRTLSESVGSDAREEKGQCAEWRNRAIHAEAQVEALQEQLRAAEERAADDARRLDGLVAEVVALAGKQSAKLQATGTVSAARK